MKGQKFNALNIHDFQKTHKQPIQEISIIFQKPTQISPPSTPEEIYTIHPKSNRNTINYKNTSAQSNTTISQKILHNNNFHLPYFPKSFSPKKLNEQQQISHLNLKRNTYSSLETPIQRNQQNRRATKLCSKVLQKYKYKNNS